MRMKFYRPQIVNILLAFTFISISASIISFNIFTVPIEQYEPKLTSIWSRGLGLSSFVSSIGDLITVSILNAPKSTSSSPSTHLTTRVRIMSLLMSLMYLSMILSVSAIRNASSTLLFASVLPLGIPSAFYYLTGMDALLAWLPNHPALAMTVVSSAYGFSQFIFSPILYILISKLGLEKTLIAIPISNFFIVSLCGLIFRFPSRYDLQTMKQLNSSSTTNYHLHDNEQTPLILNEEALVENSGDNDDEVSWCILIRKPLFYKYMAIVFLGRVAVPLLPYYFKLGYVFKIPTGVVVISFQVLSLIAVGWSLTVNSVYECVTKRLNREAVRPFLIIVFASQAMLYLMLIPISLIENATLAIFFVSLLIIMLESQTAYSVILAGEMFGKQNAVTIYGLASGLAIGPAESLFTLGMSIVEKRFSIHNISQPITFITYYWFSAASLLLGALLVK